MNTKLIKTRLIETIGEKPTAFLQALRFAYIIKIKSKIDPEISLLPRFLSKGDIAVDVGANSADWTYRLHTNVGKTGRVYAFEAEPYYALATSLAIRMLRMKGVRLFPYGLSDIDGHVALKVMGSNGLRLTGESRIDRNSKADDPGVKKIEVKRLDSLAKEIPELSKTRLIKCDVEGYELFVFKGATEVLTRSRPFVILETGNYESQGYTGEDMFNFFENLEYVPFAMVGKNNISKTDTSLNREGALSVNRVLIPSEQLDNIRRNISIVG